MNCKNCNGKKVNLFHDKVWSLDNGKVYRCGDCELIFIDPMMNKEEENNFYKNYNAHVKDRGVTINNSTTELHEKSKFNALERFNIIKKYFQDKKVLEIGSSTGAFLSLLNSCQTHACEMATDNLKYSKQFINGNAYNTIEEVVENDFDIICMYHVFEHIREPVTFLRELKLLLKPKGYIIIEVPCSNDPLLTLFDSKEFKDFVFQPMHPMVYNEKSLDYVFKSAGLKNLETIHHQRYGLENHLSWFKNKTHGGDVLLTKLFGSNDFYKNILQSIEKTDTIFYIAQIA
jgi:2-polyprenyl-3-methyl-5-hydroxy-6-metoxy-1,4-benzoquinol methylase